jgi:nickel-dependent lactate racemase
MQRAFTIPFGRGEISFELPRDMDGHAVESERIAPLPDLRAAVAAAIASPLGTPPLSRLAEGRRSVCIVVTDATRSCPDRELVGAMLDALHAAGVRAADVTLLVAVGMHRASTDAEKREKLGDGVVDRYRVVDHDARDADGLVDLGRTANGAPAVCSRLALEADLLLATGVVEPHQFAGYSGGRKIVAVGVAGEATIAHTHGPQFLDLPGTRLGRIDGNPFHDACLEIADRVGLDFVVNVVADDAGRPVAVAAGDHRAVLAELVGVASRMYTAPIPAQVDVAVAGIDHPKDANLYQASRAASYLQFAPTPVVRPGGAIVLPAAIPEGAGHGAGEQRFFEALRGATDLDAYIDAARRNGTRPGEQRAYLMARVLREVSVIVAGATDPEIPRAAHMLAERTLEAALARAAQVVRSNGPATGQLSALVVPHALHTLPVIAEPGRSGWAGS